MLIYHFGCILKAVPCLCCSCFNNLELYFGSVINFSYSMVISKLASALMGVNPRYRHFHEKWVLHRRSENWKGSLFQGYFQQFYLFLHENKEKSELKFTLFFLQNKDIFRNLTPFCVKFTPFFKSSQIKLKLNIFILNRYWPHYTMR